jgi:hypothetical protein
MGLAASGVSWPRASRAQALAAPHLEPFEGKSHSDYYLVKGEVDAILADGWVRIYRNGTAVDSVSVATSTQFSRRVPLLQGDNVIVAVLRDNKFNESPTSNRVFVTFDPRSGLYVPVPMTPGATFSLNASEPAIKAELRIFDTGGDLVVRFESHESRTIYSFPWDGKNGSHQNVRRGPLVAVGTIDYPDGTRDVLRQVFVYDTQAAP